MPSPTDTTPGFGGYHPGVCQFLLGDGSVRSVSSRTDPAVLALHEHPRVPGPRQNDILVDTDHLL